jgi:hypothetical protein
MNQERLERIRLLSRRFRELQGLRVALAGAAMAFVFGGYVLTTPEPTYDGAIGALLAWFVIVIPCVWSMNRYYAARFGRQVPRPRKLGPILIVGFAYSLVGTVLNAWIEGIPTGTPTLAIVAFCSVWLAIRDWPWRAYYLAPTVAVAIGFAASAPISGILAPNMTLPTIFILLGVSMVPVGILDHLLLVRLVKEARELQPAGEASQPT